MVDSLVRQLSLSLLFQQSSKLCNREIAERQGVPHGLDRSAHDAETGIGRLTGCTRASGSSVRGGIGQHHHPAVQRVAAAAEPAPSRAGRSTARRCRQSTTLTPDSAIGRNGIHGIWSERDVAFDASLLKAGTDTITLTVPAGTLTAGIIYDYLRLELE